MNQKQCRLHIACLFLVTLSSCFLKPLTAQPVSMPNALVIDAAPSVVSYQGSSQNYAHLVISPRGRALGYVAPTNLNHTVHHTEKVKDNLDFLDIRPIYVQHK